MMQDVHVELNTGFPWHRRHSARRNSFLQHNGLKFKEGTVKYYIWSTALYDAAIRTLREIGQK